MVYLLSECVSECEVVLNNAMLLTQRREGLIMYSFAYGILSGCVPGSGVACACPGVANLVRDAW